MQKCFPMMALVLATLFASPVLAHARLEKSNPAAGDMPAAPVLHIDLYYSEGLEPTFSNATLTDDKGAPVKAVSALDPKDDKHLVLTPAVPLTDGTYKVEWHAVSVDTHKTQGAFQFMVMP